MQDHTSKPADAALLDYRAAQTYLGCVSRSTLKQLVGRGELRICRIGRRTLFQRSALDEYISRLSGESRP